ncbi:MAG: tetratricopeptide repeat protein, partial [Kiritimatiellia bacterium]
MIPRPFQRLPVSLLLGAVALAGTLRAEPAPPTNPPSARQEERALLADGLFRRGLYRMAEQEYQAVLASNPNPIYLFRLGECCRKQNKNDEADKAYRRVIELAPTNPVAQRAYIQRALLAVQRGQIDKAKAAFSVMSGTRFPPDIRQIAFYHLGECHEKSTNLTAAAEAYASALAQSSDGDYSIYAKARLAWLLSQNRKDANSLRKAEALQLELAAVKDPTVAAPALAAAALLAATPEQAIERYVRLRADFPDTSSARDAVEPLASLYLQTAQTNQALALLDVALPTLQPPAANTLALMRAVLLAHNRRWSDAIAAFRTFLKVQPNNASARFGLLQALFETRQDAELIREVSALPRDTPRLVDLLWMQALAAERAKASDAGVLFSRLADSYPDSPYAADSLYRAAWLAQEKKHYQDAIKLYAELARRYPQHALAPKALLASASASLEASDSEAALQALTLLLSAYPTAPEAPEALYRKALVLIQLSRLPAAAVALDEYLSRNPNAPDLPEAFFWRGEVARRQHDLVTAEANFRKALQFKLSEQMAAEVRLALGALLKSQKRDAEAVDFFKPLLATSTGRKLTPAQLEWLAQYLLDRGQPQEALVAAQSLLAVAATTNVAPRIAGQALAALAHRRLKNRDASLAACRRALELKGRSDWSNLAELTLGELLLEQGDEKAALVHFASVARLANQQ